MHATLKLIGTMYRVFGVTSLLTFWMYLRYGPAINALDSGSLPMYFGLLGICMANATIGALICFSFWSLKPWGRYLAIGFNVVWLGTMTFGFVVGRITEGTVPPLRSFLLFIGILMLLPVAITWFLIRSDVKMFMEQKKGTGRITDDVCG